MCDDDIGGPCSRRCSDYSGKPQQLKENQICAASGNSTLVSFACKLEIHLFGGNCH